MAAVNRRLLVVGLRILADGRSAPSGNFRNHRIHQLIHEEAELGIEFFYGTYVASDQGINTRRPEGSGMG